MVERKRYMLQPSKYIELPNHIKISYFETGSSAGVPMILLHGLADSWHIFELLIRYLPKTIHIYAMTQRGHGDSSRPDSGYGTEDFEGDIVMFMDSMNIEKAVILGASSGGFPARSFAINHPERTLALVLLGSPATLRDIPAVQEVWDTTISKLTDPVDREFVETFTMSTLPKSINQEFLELTLQENLKLPARVWRDTTEGIMREEFPGKLDKISSPTLIIWGDQDKLLTRRSQKELAGVIPGSKLVVHKNAGHMLYCEDPKGIASDIVTFINSL
jgi:non-heme chloroperoxidase